MLKSTVRSGAVARACVALAPLLTDAAIIALAVTVLRALPATALAIVGGTGALFLAYLSFDAFREAQTSHLHPLAGTTASKPACLPRPSPQLPCCYSSRASLC